jgi:acyl-CoA thioesterase I
MIVRRPYGGGIRPAWVFAAGFAAMLVPVEVGLGGGPACAVPSELMDVDPDAKLPHLAERLRLGGPVKIVAIGGGSTAGLASGSTDLSYPHQLQQRLASWYPTVAIVVANKGIPRQTAEQMLARFPKDVFAEDPVLVIWETGITDAVRGIGVDDFAATLQDGVDELAARGIDLILVDMQFSHRTEAIIDFESYLRAIHRVGDVKDVYVFPRFAMMRYWSEQEVFDLDGVAKNDRASLAANVYQCLGRELADAIRIVLQ